MLAFLIVCFCYLKYIAFVLSLYISLFLVGHVVGGWVKISKKNLKEYAVYCKKRKW